MYYEEHFQDDTIQELETIVEDVFENPLKNAEKGMDNWDEWKENERFKALMMPTPVVWAVSKFERSFTQTLGQYIYEKFARSIADSNPKCGSTDVQHTIEGKIPTQQSSAIEEVLHDLDNGTEPDWEKEISRVVGFENNAATENVSVTWDVWIEDFQDGRPLCVEIKTPKPNKDQSIAAKRKMLKTVAMYERNDAPTPIPRFVFPFNPYGSRDEYNHAHVKKIFDVQHSEAMLVADEFWNAIGGDGTYKALHDFLRSEVDNKIEELEDVLGDNVSLGEVDSELL